MMMPKTALPAGNAADATALYKRLWIHEALRVFYDRLVDEQDREWLLDQVRNPQQNNCTADLLMGPLFVSGLEHLLCRGAGVRRRLHLTPRPCRGGLCAHTSAIAAPGCWFLQSV